MTSVNFSNSNSATYPTASSQNFLGTNYEAPQDINLPPDSTYVFPSPLTSTSSTGSSETSSNQPLTYEEVMQSLGITIPSQDQNTYSTSLPSDLVVPQGYQAVYVYDSQGNSVIALVRNDGTPVTTSTPFPSDFVAPEGYQTGYIPNTVNGNGGYLFALQKINNSSTQPPQQQPQQQQQQQPQPQPQPQPYSTPSQGASETFVFDEVNNVVDDVFDTLKVMFEGTPLLDIASSIVEGGLDIASIFARKTKAGIAGFVLGFQAA